jgi:hypothetical protein
MPLDSYRASADASIRPSDYAGAILGSLLIAVAASTSGSIPVRLPDLLSGRSPDGASGSPAQAGCGGVGSGGGASDQIGSVKEIAPRFSRPFHYEATNNVRLPSVCQRRTREHALPHLLGCAWGSADTWSNARGAGQRGPARGVLSLGRRAAAAAVSVRGRTPSARFRTLKNLS